MTVLAGGDYGAAVPGLDRRDEIGRMAAAVQVFRQNGTENEKLRQDVESERQARSEEHTSELQSLMRISYAVFCLKKKKKEMDKTKHPMKDTHRKNNDNNSQYKPNKTETTQV